MTFDFFDLVLGNWNRPMKEVSGYKTIETEKGYLLVVNALGINKSDLEIKLEGNTLSIKGVTELKEIDFSNSVSYKFKVGTDRLDSIEYDVKDGLAYIYLNIKHKQNEIEIKAL